MIRPAHREALLTLGRTVAYRPGAIGQSRSTASHDRDGDDVLSTRVSRCGGRAVQRRWYLDHLGNGKYNIRAVHSGKCLDVEGGTGATGDGVNVHQWSCLGSGQTNQQWAFSVD
ncbi:RICIN domain-containing protein [Streptomyces sp. NPDC012765]|uniref:RICIN domain-containing protein n=1 Tax=Streptomyces sp. NPDC012765 TaxID=3155249 RepID=UPI00340C8FE5